MSLVMRGWSSWCKAEAALSTSAGSCCRAALPGQVGEALLAKSFLKNHRSMYDIIIGVLVVIMLIIKTILEAAAAVMIL